MKNLLKEWLGDRGNKRRELEKTIEQKEKQKKEYEQKILKLNTEIENLKDQV